MTVIVFDRKNWVIAADSQSIRDWDIVGKANKIHVFHQRYLYASCGGTAHGASICNILADKLKNQSPRHGILIGDPKLGDLGSSGILIDSKKKNIFLIDGGCIFNAPQNNYYFMGSGGQFAGGALAAGKSALEAVKIACKLDVGCGLPAVAYKITKHGIRRIYK